MFYNWIALTWSLLCSCMSACFHCWCKFAFGIVAASAAQSWRLLCKKNLWCLDWCCNGCTGMSDALVMALAQFFPMPNRFKTNDGISPNNSCVFRHSLIIHRISLINLNCVLNCQLLRIGMTCKNFCLQQALSNVFHRTKSCKCIPVVARCDCFSDRSSRGLMQLIKHWSGAAFAQ